MAYFGFVVSESCRSLETRRTGQANKKAYGHVNFNHIVANDIDRWRQESRVSSIWGGEEGVGTISIRASHEQ